MAARAFWTGAAACAALGCAPELQLGDGPGAGGEASSGGEVEWARAFDSEGAQAGPKVAVAGDGSAVLLGKLTSRLAIDGMSVSPLGAENVFWARLASGDGRGIGLKRFGAFDPQIANALATDVNGDLLVAGEFSGKVEFGGEQLESTGGRDGYFARLATEGEEIWLKPLGGVGFQAGASAAGSADGGTVVAGRFSGSLVIDSTVLKSAGNSDVFVASFDAAGALLGASRFGDGFEQRSGALAVDAAGDTIVTGEFAGGVDFGGGPLQSAGDFDVFVAKLGPGGEHLWSRRFGDAGAQRARAVAVDGAGNVIVGGEFAGTIDFGGGSWTAEDGEAVFVAKLGPGGELLWSRRFGEQGGASLGQLIADGAGNVLVVGGFRGQARLAEGVVTSAGEEDVFVTKLDPEGELLWSRQFGGAGEDRGTGAALDTEEGAVFVTGAFTGRVDFGGASLESGAGAEVFAVKLSP
jgi:hypothetical protein